MVAGARGVSLSPEHLIHEHALDQSAINIDQLASIAKHSGLKAKKQSIEIADIERLGSALPAIALLNNGNYVVVVGVNKKDGALLIKDPMANTRNIFPLDAEEFAGYWSRQLLLLKKSYGITDDQQPFGLGWFIPEILKQKSVFRDVALAAISLHFLGILTPIFFQLVIDKVLVHQSFSTLNVLTIGIIIAIIFEAIFGYLRKYLLLEATNKIDIRLVTKTFSHLLALPIQFFERSAAGVTVRHMQQVEKIREFLTGQLFLTTLDATVLLIYLPILYFYSPLLCGVVVGFTLLIGLVMLVLIRPFRKRLKELYNAEADRQAMLVETITGMRTVKSLALEPVQRRYWDKKASKAVRSHFKVGKISITANAITGLLQKLMMVTIIALGAHQVFDNVITVGALIAFNMISGRVVSPLVQVVSLIHQYQETALSVNMLGNIMNHPPERKPGKAGLRPPLKGNIRFEKVNFSYTPGGAKTLDNISFNIPSGSVIGVVGKSGSGKSTLIKLLQGMYPLQEGVIRLDNFDIREIDLDFLRRNTGVVLQDSFLFRGTVRENISVTKPDASLQEIDFACKLAGATEFIEKLPQGYDTLLEENADNLSGGQKQRLAIARALLTKPRFLMLDEATSALDPDSEAIFMNNLEYMAKGRTVVIVSHRLSTLISCTAIVVMNEGKIVDAGTHDELLGRCQIYQHLWHQQNRHLSNG